MIDESDVQAYVRMPDCLIKGCSDDMAIFIADGGNHFTDYVIYEGMFLFFGLNKPFLKVGFPATLTRMMTQNRNTESQIKTSTDMSIWEDWL